MTFAHTFTNERTHTGAVEAKDCEYKFKSFLVCIIIIPRELDSTVDSSSLLSLLLVCMGRLLRHLTLGPTID